MADRNIVGMVIPDGTNQFFSGLAQAMQRALLDRSWAVITMDSQGSPVRERQYLEELKGLGVAGLIFVSVGDSPTAYRFLGDWQPPLLVLDRVIALDLENADCVLADSREGVRQVIEHLAALGHDRVGYVRGAENTEPGRVRGDSLFEAAEHANISVPDDCTFNGSFDYASGYDAAQRICDMNGTERPTAVFAANDLMAIGLLQGLQERGVAIPEDVSIVGFDNIPAAGWVYPRLTTVEQNISEIADVGARFLDERLRSAPTVKPPQSHVKVITPRLIARDSSGPAHR